MDGMKKKYKLSDTATNDDADRRTCSLRDGKIDQRKAR